MRQDVPSSSHVVVGAFVTADWNIMSTVHAHTLWMFTQEDLRGSIMVTRVIMYA